MPLMIKTQLQRLGRHVERRIPLENIEYLEKGIEEIGLDSDETSLAKLERYKDLLVEWNEKMNLTAITEDREVYIKHFVDSIACMLTEEFTEGKTVIDVGTGAGFPGLPLKIYEEGIKLTLLDSLKKRIGFLQTVCSELELEDVEFVHGRAEDFGKNPDYREKYDIAVSRAVASLNVLLEYCTPFLKVGGVFVCQKGPAAGDELKEASKAIEVLGLRLKNQIEVKLPFMDITHYVLVFEKISSTPSKYPRKAGMPSKKPIA